MKRSLVLIVVACVAGALVGWLALSRLYLRPRGELVRSAERSRQWISFYETELKREAGVRAELAAAGQRVLDDSVQGLDARLRSLLDRIASEQGLSGVQVGTTSPVPAVNPMITAKVPDVDRRLRARAEAGRPDFSTVRGDLSGSGSIDQVMRAIAVVSAQAWVHRIESLSIRPTDGQREKFALRMIVSTVHAPDLAPASKPEPVPVLASDAVLALAAGVAQRNPFRLSVPAATTVALPGSTRPAGPATDAEWRLTGVVTGRMGVEALLVNTRSGEARSVPAGGVLGDFKLIEAAGERAVFEMSGQRFEVENGQTLEQRRPGAR